MPAAPQKQLSQFEIARRQRGVVLLVIMLVTITFGGYFGVRALNATRERSGIDELEAQQILAQSKAALLAWSVASDDTVAYGVITGSAGVRAFRPGNLPYPDLATGLTDTGPSDGVRDHGCAKTTWTGTQTLIPVTQGMGSTNKSTIRCLGRLPVTTLGLDRLAGDAADNSGRWPWYVVSANLVNISHDCPRRLDGTIVNVGNVTPCAAADSDATTKLAFPWITVLDPSGVVVTTRAAAVIMLPGAVTTRQPGNAKQIRSTTALPTEFLDTVDNTACAALPAGRCDNASLNQSPRMTFIQCVNPATTTGDARFNANYACNDRLVYITVDELFSHAAKRMEREFVGCLQEYARNHGGDYPWPTTLTSTSPGVINQFGPSAFPSDDENFIPICPSVSTTERYANYWQGWQLDTSYKLAADRKSASFSFKSLPGRNVVKVP